jgi:hypothetical protein
MSGVRIPPPARSLIVLYSVGGILKRPTRTDCKSVGFTFEGSNPSPPTTKNLSGSSSVGRASAFQAEGREFESRLPLIKLKLPQCCGCKSRCSSGVERVLGKDEVGGSNPPIGSGLRMRRDKY